jgi:cell division protein FtsQ
MSYSSTTQRQTLRRRQSGQLNKSILIALSLIALVSVGFIKADSLKILGEHLTEQTIAWSAKQGFTIQRLDVAGRKQVSAQEMLKTLQAQSGTPIFSYCPQKAAARLSENPWFKTVFVERRLPDTVFVRVEERIPAARWQVRGKLAVIDVEGIVLTTENLGLYNDLPIIIGQEARHKVIDLFNLLQGEPSISKQLAAATWIGNRRWNLNLKNGIVIKLPSQDATRALSAFVALDKQDKILERDIVSVDLRLDGQVTLQPTVRANAMIERPDFSDTPDPTKKAI